jgi:hypothetical protein
MATVNLGSIKFKWKGTYAGGTAYTVDDVVEYNGSSYICILASTGNLPTNATYFEQMSSAGTNGTNGTDLGTTLTTQGDLVYRDGSGLQRLGAGTAGQVLQTGGAGANPSWGTVSSDFVKLGETGSFSSVASVDLNGLFSSNYKIYKVYGYNVYSASGGNQLNFRGSTGGSYTPFTSSVYHYAGDGWMVSSGSNSSYAVASWNTNAGRINWSGGGNFNTSDSWEMTIYNPESPSYYKMFTIESGGWDGSGIFVSLNTSNYIQTTTALTGLQIGAFTGGGNITGENIIMYGVKS